MNAAIRSDPLNWQAESLTEAETLIKRAVTDAVFSGTPFQVLNARIQKIIEAAEKRLTSPALKEAARRSLNVFATRIYQQLRAQVGTDWEFLAAVLLLVSGKSLGRRRAERVVMTRRSGIYDQANGIPYALETDAKGIPMQMYAKDYADKVVRPALDKLAEAKALDPDDYAGRNSLRNLAEMQVRYEGHLEEIAELKAGGQKLVVCSVHADCSDRCAPWQGRVYSLDGTSGKTDDGRDYIPLEAATDIYYTTKAGKTYKNGLLGFNCRHKLSPYRSGVKPPTVSAVTQKREYEITRQQRAYERAIREARDKAAVFRERFPKEATKWRARAAELNKEYIEFSIKHNRAYYPSRTKIL